MERADIEKEGSGGNKKYKVFSFSTFAPDWHSGAFRTKTKSNSTDRGLGKWERQEETQETLLPDASCLFTYYLVFSHHPLIWKKKKELCLRGVLGDQKSLN